MMNKEILTKSLLPKGKADQIAIALEMSTVCGQKVPSEEAIEIFVGVNMLIILEMEFGRNDLSIVENWLVGRYSNYFDKKAAKAFSLYNKVVLGAKAIHGKSPADISRVEGKYTYDF